MNDLTKPLLDTVTLVADQQVMSDEYAGTLWAGNLDRAKANGDIRDYRILGSWEGAFGLQHVAFTVDVPLDGRRFWPSYGHTEIQDAGQDLLCEIAGDSDVFVRWVTNGFMGQPTVADALESVARILTDDPREAK